MYPELVYLYLPNVCVLILIKLLVLSSKLKANSFMYISLLYLFLTPKWYLGGFIYLKYLSDYVTLLFSHTIDTYNCTLTKWGGEWKNLKNKHIILKIILNGKKETKCLQLLGIGTGWNLSQSLDCTMAELGSQPSTPEPHLLPSVLECSQFKSCCSGLLPLPGSIRHCP